MFVATPVHRNLRNLETGIDVTVPAVLEIEAPLGGTSIEYEISVVTNLPDYKAKLHKDDDVVHFTVQKAYRELEDFYDKISKKLNVGSLPVIPRGRTTLQCSSEEKRVSLDALMKYISSNKGICHSALFQQFIGINRLKHQSAITSVSKTCSKSEITEVFSSLSPETESNNPVISSKIVGDSESSADGISELFPKMKVRKSSQSNSIKEEEFANNISVPLKKEEVLAVEDFDLFEEAKQIKEVKNKETQIFDSDRKSHHGLFDASDDDANLFRINSPTPCKNTATVSRKVPGPAIVTSVTDGEKHLKSEEIFSSLEKEKVKEIDKAKAEQILCDLGKTGNIFLFEEQDFGIGITKEDEKLFYIPDREFKHESKANPFLSPSSESTEEDDIEESLEELTALSEPSSSDLLVSKWKEVEKVPEYERRTSESAPLFPVESLKKPPVLPRKKSLPKPSLPPKPTIPPKPKAATKPPIIAKKPLTKPAESRKDVTEKHKATVQNMNTIDIMQYIEQEQKLAGMETSLFD